MATQRDVNLMDRKHLFVLCPPASGSTLLWRILQTSPYVSAFNKEGKGLVKSILSTKDRWNPSKMIQWEIVKERWEEEWDYDKPILLEKSPPHLVRANQLEQHFPESFFLIMVRNPYAFCEGIRRRHYKNSSYYNIAKFWVICSKYQIDNIVKLKKSILFTYEELTSNPNRVSEKIIEFIPELREFRLGEEFNVFEKSMKISNLNQKQINRLSDGDIYEINMVLRKYPDIMSFFDYDYLEQEGKIRFKTLRTLSAKLRSMNRRPRAIRWTKI
jgi:hypothetical protein